MSDKYIGQNSSHGYGPTPNNGQRQTAFDKRSRTATSVEDADRYPTTVPAGPANGDVNTEEKV
jgi:hypothetical protein